MTIGHFVFAYHFFALVFGRQGARSDAAPARHAISLGA
jgi:cytochrome c oxidase cbb3-type subunit 1